MTIKERIATRTCSAGKITVLQLSALLKQADSSKHKLTLTRLSTAPIPFTVLSLSGNPWNEDLLAVCGLKECHVLTFNSAGKLLVRFDRWLSFNEVKVVPYSVAR